MRFFTNTKQKTTVVIIQNKIKHIDIPALTCKRVKKREKKH